MKAGQAVFQNRLKTVSLCERYDHKNEIQGYVFKIENSLADLRPDIAKKWNYEKNGNLTPEMFSIGSEEIVWWKCPKCGHEWKISINSMTGKKRGNGCAVCAKTERAKKNIITKI